MKVTRVQLIEAIASTGGNLSAIARKHSMTRQGVAKRIENDPDLKNACEAARDELVDDAVDGLRQSVKQRRPWAIRFVLGTLGRTRGFGKTLNIETPANQSQVIVYLPDNGRGTPDPDSEE